MDNNLNNVSQNFSYPSTSDDVVKNVQPSTVQATPSVIQSNPVASNSVASDLVTPNPVAPNPVTPSPVAPNPVTPSPVAPNLVTPSPVAPSPVAPNSVAPNPVAPNSISTSTQVPASKSTQQSVDQQGSVVQASVAEPNRESQQPVSLSNSDSQQPIDKPNPVAQQPVSSSKPVVKANQDAQLDAVTQINSASLDSVVSVDDKKTSSKGSITPTKVAVNKNKKDKSALEALADKLSTFKDSLLTSDTPEEAVNLTTSSANSKIKVDATTSSKLIGTKDVNLANPVSNNMHLHTDNTIEKNKPIVQANKMKSVAGTEIKDINSIISPAADGKLPGSYTTVTPGKKKKKKDIKKKKAKTVLVDAANSNTLSVEKSSIQTSRLAKNIDLDLVTGKTEASQKTNMAVKPNFDPASVVNPVNIIDSTTKKVVPKVNVKDSVTSDARVTSFDGKYPLNIHQLMDFVIERNASDLHLSVGYPATVRVDGSLVPVSEVVLTEKMANELVTEILPDAKKELLEVNREVDLAYAHGKKARFRINAYYQQQTLAAAFRLIPNKIRSLEELKMPLIFNQLAKLRQGFVLVTGPTGSGKSTTLAALVQEINKTRTDHIITVEDPIEYIYPKGKAFIDQRELHDDTHSWEIAMKSALRQDPDVVLVGELRDYETISAAITLAETGHLVFATLHTNSASQTVDRLIDVFPEHQQAQVRSQLSNALEAVVAQRLIPLDKGGRIAVTEVLIATPAIRNLIREGKTHQLNNVIITSSDIGMTSMESSLVKLVREGVITMERAQEYAVHPEEVVRLLK